MVRHVPITVSIFRRKVRKQTPPEKIILNQRAMLKRSSARRGVFFILIIFVLVFLWPTKGPRTLFDEKQQQEIFYKNYLQYVNSMETPMSPPEGFTRWLIFASNRNCSLNLDDYVRIYIDLRPWINLGKIPQSQLKYLQSNPKMVKFRARGGKIKHIPFTLSERLR